MPIDPDARQRFTDRQERISEKHLRKLGVEVERLDHQGPQKRPEFILKDRTTGHPVALVEVKAPVSAGYDHEDGIHISTLDAGALDGKVRSFDPVPASYLEAMADAVEKYRATVKDIPEYVGLPYLVVLMPDLLADTPLVDRRQPPEVTGILRLEENRELYDAARKMSKEELRRRIENGDRRGLRPESKSWRLLPNPRALVPVPDHIALHCDVGHPEDPEDWDGEGAVPAKVVRRPAGPKP